MICVNTPSAFRIGTVGKPISSVEVTIAADGEILTRGPHVMRGYYNKPDATREAVDGDGWFHTGDIGELREGYLAITDRKKDIIVTAGGKNIAPQPIENLVVTNPFVAQAVMIGDKRRYPVMVVVPDFVQLEKWAKAQNVSAPTRAALIALPAVRKKIEDEVAASLKELARFEMPKRVGLIEREFSVDGGELTPTLKVKRRVVNEHYKELIDTLYEGDESSQTVY